MKLPKELEGVDIGLLSDDIFKARARGLSYSDISARLGVPARKVREIERQAIQAVRDASEGMDWHEQLVRHYDEVIAQAWKDHATSKAEKRAPLLEQIRKAVEAKAKLLGYETPGGSTQQTLVVNSLADILPKLKEAER